VLDFLMDYESHRILVSSKRGATNRPENIVIRYVSFVSLVYLYVIFEFESSRRFQFSFRDFPLVYRSAFAQIFPRLKPMRESNTCTCSDS
jgi:hypothetical protein